MDVLRHIYRPNCGLSLFPVQWPVFSHNFYNSESGKIEKNFHRFCCLLEWPEAQFHKAIRFLVRPNFLRLLKSWKTDEDLQCAVETSRSISMWQSWEKQLTKPFKLITHFPDFLLSFPTGRSLPSLWSVVQNLIPIHYITPQFLLGYACFIVQPFSALRATIQTTVWTYFLLKEEGAKT